ncbi:hypothetical protein LCGC14_2157460 [marine sediment metagenome]|uniref:DNA methylase N-4/N-6 domain-containing protein n=1 Tax=marine sediment metagenome TaxID=412755 RepID=A0A0F9DTW6_9ZZZZ
MLIHGDCLEILPTLDADSMDSCVTDPPYGINFMSKNWDHGVPGEHFWREVLRVLKPGAHLLTFGGTRTYHRLACAIEDAGFEIRDCLMWVYGSGFAKGLNISKASNALHGVERERNVIPDKRSTLHGDRPWMRNPEHRFESNIPITEDAKKWDGWGTCLKPAYEPIILARKPVEGTVASNVLKYGTGGLNIDACRVEHNEPERIVNRTAPKGNGITLGVFANNDNIGSPSQKGRFPSNFIHDGSDEVTGLFPETTSGSIELHHKTHESENNCMSGKNYEREPQQFPASSGSAARFFYTAKSSKAERSAPGMKSDHPTVKPISLMRYLCKLITPPKGTVLDPFMGSGSTGMACIEEGFEFIGIELGEHYLEIAENRINHAQPTLF